ncbi:uncharacterized protein MELLADRAFT_124479 [Melampsora larici-populina 98AG31]|uniref:Secreted protein n=1 Tax=Melampsora larici-populina (strain 98AG31 / pathotype 3-4-7) TaxID=747676 RepID=F4RYD3_MELLP|nr:uncharacterized protein MELLADRAFT_124479 [Melampsora larici-populina 98AG31]EGG02594.1 secreted protein [Melampsora larici-populina 98AG31]
MMSQQYFKLLVVFLGLIAMIAPIAKGKSKNKPRIPKCGSTAATCKKGTPSCVGYTPSCGQGGKFNKCPEGVKCLRF